MMFTVFQNRELNPERKNKPLRERKLPLYPSVGESAVALETAGVNYGHEDLPLWGDIAGPSP